MTHSSNTPAKELTKITKTVKDYGEGIQLLAHIETEQINIDYIKIPANLRRQGIATHILEEIKTLADTHKLPIKILPSTDFGTPLAALIKLYTTNGFTYQQANKHFWYHPNN